MPDISEATHRVDHDTSLTPEEQLELAAPDRGRLRGEEREAEHHPPAAARPFAVRARRELRGAGRRGADRRRIHRPHDAGAAVVGRPASGGGGQGGRAREGGDADPGHDHDPELLPHVRQAGRHDGHRGNGGARVLRDLQARGLGDPDQPAGDPRRPPRPRVQDAAREVQRDRRGDAAACTSSGFPVLIGTTSVDASETLAQLFQRARHRPQRPQRQVPPARGRDRGRRRPARRGDDRDQHGRPRHRHQTRTRRHRLETVGREGSRRQRYRRRPRSAASTSSDRNATSRGASTGSCAAAPAGRAIRARRSSSCRWKTT